MKIIFRVPIKGAFVHVWISGNIFFTHLSSAWKKKKKKGLWTHFAIEMMKNVLIIRNGSKKIKCGNILNAIEALIIYSFLKGIKYFLHFSLHPPPQPHYSILHWNVFAKKENKQKDKHSIIVKITDKNTKNTVA